MLHLNATDYADLTVLNSQLIVLLIYMYLICMYFCSFVLDIGGGN